MDKPLRNKTISCVWSSTARGAVCVVSSVVLALIREGRYGEQRLRDRIAYQKLCWCLLDAFFLCLRFPKMVIRSFWVEPKVLLGLHFRWVHISWDDPRSWFWSKTMWGGQSPISWILWPRALLHTANKPKFWASSLGGLNPVWCLGHVVEMFYSIWFVLTLMLMIIAAANV